MLRYRKPNDKTEWNYRYGKRNDRLRQVWTFKLKDEPVSEIVYRVKTTRWYVDAKRYRPHLYKPSKDSDFMFTVYCMPEVR